MLKKEITYTDFNGNQRTDDYYFNLTKAEVIEWDAEYPDGAIQYFNSLVKNQNVGKLVKVFKDLILRSYGEKTESGRFLKTQELRDSFMASEAYSELFLEVTANEENMAAFINGIVPKVTENTGNVSPIPAPIG